jgi:translation initiation factor IF-2
MAKSELQNQIFVPRPAVVVVMGHIDHGKTTLLDYIRKTNVAEKEAGAITQHLGAYEAEALTKDGQKKKIVFLDTPGHEAFEKLRERGAKIADIAVLVIAADEGVKPQTLEAFEAIRRANLNYIIALNKIDKPEANPEKIKKELSEHKVFIEEWGGKVPLVQVSAKTGEGIEELLEMILLMAEIMELKADPQKPASGVVIENYLDSKRGVGAVLLIREGTLKSKRFVAAPTAFAPVRIFENFLGRPIVEAGPSSPVRLTGFKGLPRSGSWFKEVKTKEEAEDILREHLEKEALKEKEEFQPAKTEEIVIPLILKADVAGSLEALENETQKLKTRKFSLKIIRAEAGDISKDDLTLALGNAKTIILAFNVSVDRKIADELQKSGIKTGIFKIIYEAIDWLKETIQESLPEEIVEKTIGKAKVLKIFGKEKEKQIIGGAVLEGCVRDKAKFKIKRRDVALGEGRGLELQQNKIKSKEVAAGSQFGFLVESKIEIAPGDTLEIFEEERRKISL